jgi:hypothetical protein
MDQASEKEVGLVHRGEGIRMSASQEGPDSYPGAPERRTLRHQRFGVRQDAQVIRSAGWLRPAYAKGPAQ